MTQIHHNHHITHFYFFHPSKKGSKDQESIQSSTTPDPGYHMGKWQSTIKHHKQEPIGQPFPSRWPQGSNEQTRKHKTPDINNTHDPQKKYRLGTVSTNTLLEWLNRFHGEKSSLNLIPYNSYDPNASFSTKQTLIYRWEDWCLMWCHWGLTVDSFAPLLSCMYCWAFIVILFPFYNLICMY